MKVRQTWVQVITDGFLHPSVRTALHEMAQHRGHTLRENFSCLIVESVLTQANGHTYPWTEALPRIDASIEA